MLSNFETIHLIQVFIASVLGFLVGSERALHNKHASIRTFSLVCVAACMFTIASEFTGEPARITAQVVSGIGFIGAGIIFKGQGKPAGVTTAAMLWFVGALGILCGLGEILFGVSCFLVYIFILTMGHFLRKKLS